MDIILLVLLLVHAQPVPLLAIVQLVLPLLLAQLVLLISLFKIALLKYVMLLLLIVKHKLMLPVRHVKVDFRLMVVLRRALPVHHIVQHVPLVLQPVQHVLLVIS